MRTFLAWVFDAAALSVAELDVAARRLEVELDWDVVSVYGLFLPQIMASEGKS